MINFILWLMVVAVIGWVASLVLATEGHWGTVVKVVVGLVGAALADWFLAPVVGLAALPGAFNLDEFFIALVGAIILLTVVSAFHRGSVR